MTLHEAYALGQEKLVAAGIDDAAQDAWLLLEYVTGVRRAAYFMDMHKELEEKQENEYWTHIETRCKRIPLQHITGCQEFMGLSFLVNEHVLVPRQDTEVLVETVLEDVKSGMKVLDMCTGSGCILLSLLKLGKGLNGTGVDISEDALKVAEKNAKTLGVDATFLHSDLFEHVEETFDVIVSNPPYIRTDVIKGLEEEVKLHDPMLALDGKEDGLYFYREIVKQCPKYLNAGGKVYFEIGHDQGTDVKALMESSGFRGVTVKKDLAGLDRVVFGVYNISEGNS